MRAASELDWYSERRLDSKVAFLLARQDRGKGG